MKVLLTGAFGNLGQSTLEELGRQGHEIRCFDVKTKASLRAARSWANTASVVWGDVRCMDDVHRALQDQEVVIHLAFIVPKLSATGFESEEHPDWAREVNVGGTENLIRAMQAQPILPKLIFASSCHVYGPTGDVPPPRIVTDPVQPMDHYAQHKIECEQLVRTSELPWVIFRLAASMPISLKPDLGMFDVPLDTRMEYVHTRDVGLAFANAVSSEQIWGKVLHIGGGSRCQFLYGDIARRLLDGLGVGMLPAAAFATAPFGTDWLDTEESRRLLAYQRRTLDDFVNDLRQRLGWRRGLVRAFRPLVRHVLLSQSPYYGNGRTTWLSTVLQGFKAMKKKPIRIRVG